MLLIGIDDTDNHYSHGTGHRARHLVRVLNDGGFGRVRGVTRHQLLVDPAIPYTSHNSSACIALDGDRAAAAVVERCRSFLLREAAVGADAGLCIADAERALLLSEFGLQAQRRVLDRAAAHTAAAVAQAHLEGLTGNRGGLIGAAAAVGLHAAGDDGRYLWLPAIRELAGRTLGLRELRERTGLAEVRTIDGRVLADEKACIALGDWPRAVRRDGMAILLVEDQHDADGIWQVADRHTIKSLDR